jgi:hypothetical protein
VGRRTAVAVAICVDYGGRRDAIAVLVDGPFGAPLYEKWSKPQFPK